MNKNRRKRKFIEPRIQRRFILLFLSTAVAATLLQTIVLGYTLRNLAGELPTDGLLLSRAISRTLLSSFFITLCLLGPLTVALGISHTFKLVGPLYRFRVFLNDILNGNNPGPCRIRKGDELQDHCDLLNAVTASLRDQNDGSEESSESEDHAAA